MKTSNRTNRLLAAIAAVTLGATAIARADYPSTILSDSPSGYWRLGDLGVGQAPTITAGDVAANSGTGGAALNGYYFYDTAHPASGALAGSSDTAAAFDGFKHRLDVPYSPLLNSSNFSVELWVKVTNVSTRALCPISCRDTNLTRGFLIFAFNGNTNWQFRTHNSGNATNLTTTNAIQLNTWTHLVGTFDGIRMRFYVNGAEAAAPVTNTAYTPNTAAPLRLGAANHNLVGDNFWPGSMDEVAIYTNALSAAQVVAHYQNGTNASRGTPYETLVGSDNPVAYLRLNEPAYVGTTSPQAVANLGTAGAPANGVLFSVTNSAVPIPTTTNGVVGGISGALLGDANPALGFNGRDGRVDVPYNAAINPPSFTVEAWAYLPSLYRDYQAVVANRNDSSVGSLIRGHIFYAQNNNTWQFWTANGAGSGWVTLTAVNVGAVTNGQWNHLVGVYDGTNKYFYVNGALCGFSGNLTYLTNEARPLRIGGGSSETPVGSFFVAGGVDEVAVYGRALSQDRVLAHYQAALGSVPPVTNAPTFTVNSANSTNHSLQTVLLTAGAVGGLPMQLQWYYVTPDLLTTNAIPGATNNTLVISPTSITNSGWYSLQAVNSAGSTNSVPSYLEILPPQAPSLAVDLPAVVPVYLSGTTRLPPVLISGTPPISYQWWSNSVSLAGETNNTLSLLFTNVQFAASNALYTVVATNVLGSTTSTACRLKVLVPSASSYASVITNLSPIAYWRLGADPGPFAFDYWRGNHGWYLGATPNMTPGALLDDDDGATYFSGANSRVVVSNSTTFNFTGTNAFTLVVWARPDVLGSSIMRLFSNRATAGYGMGFKNNNSQIRMTGFGVADVDSSAGTFAAGQWYHLAVVRNGTTLQFFVDGALKNTGTLANINTSANPLQLGGNPTATEWFTGELDEAAVFNRALSAPEVAALYGAKFGALIAPTITQDPAASRIYAGGTARYSVAASGSQPLGYLWKSNGVAIAGATNTTLIVPNVTAGMSGVNYSVTVTNRAGSTNSVNASLTVLTPYGYQAVVVADAPTALYRLDESAGPTSYDTWGSHNGAPFNAITFGQPGVLALDGNTACGFDGISTKVEAPYAADLNPPVFSVECWARVTGNSGAYRAAVSSRDFNQGYIIYAAANDFWQFWTRTPGAAWQNQSGPAVALGEWTHLVATFDGTNKSFYANGALAATQVNTNYSPNFIRNLRIGAGNNEDDPGAGSIYPFAGDLDEVAIYNYALAPERIAVHYDMGKYSTNTPPLVVSQPVPQTVGVGTVASLTAVAGGSPLLTYQWWKDGAPLLGATQPTLLIPNAGYGDNGNYALAVTNSLGFTNSSTVKLAVMPPSQFCNLTNDLVLHLKFDGDTLDSSGRTNNGTSVGTTAFVAGKIGSQALHYITETDTSAVPPFVTNVAYVTLGTPPDLQFSTNVNFSVAYWARLPAGAKPGDLPFLCSASGSYGNWGFAFAPSYTNGGWSWSLGNASAYVGVYGPANSINDGNWHHLVHSFDRAGNGVTYLDGTQVDSRLITAVGELDNNQVVNVGQDPSGYYNEPGQADIDDLGVWRRALTAYEAQSIYAAAQNYGRSFDTYGPVRLLLSQTSGGLELIWQAGTLQHADEVTGGWTDVPGAAAPYFKVTPGLAKKFYRVRL